MEETERRAYRSLLFSIAQKLTAEDRRGLVFLYELPDRWKEKDGCDILDELGRRNKFSSTNLDGLMSALEEINREDLVNIAKKKMRDQKVATKKKQGQQVLNLKREMEMALKGLETLRFTMENIMATIGAMREEGDDGPFPMHALKSVESMMGKAHDKNKEALVMLTMASQHLGYKPSTSTTTLVLANGLLQQTESCHEPFRIQSTPPRSPTMSKWMKSGVKRILRRNHQPTGPQAVVTLPRSRIDELVPSKEANEAILFPSADDLLYEDIDATQMEERRHSLDSKKEERARRRSQMVFAVHQVPKIIDTPREAAISPRHTLIQEKTEEADDSDNNDGDGEEEEDESGYTGSTTGGDSGMEVPLYTIPILRKQGTKIAESKDEEEPKYDFPETRDRVQT